MFVLDLTNLQTNILRTTFKQIQNVNILTMFQKRFNGSTDKDKKRLRRLKRRKAVKSRIQRNHDEIK